MVFLHVYVHIVSYLVYLVYNLPKFSCDYSQWLAVTARREFQNSMCLGSELHISMPRVCSFPKCLKTCLHTASWATVLAFLSAVRKAVESWLSRLVRFTLEPQTKDWSKIPNGSLLWLLQNFSSHCPNLKLLTSMCPGSEPHTKSSLDDWAQARSKWPWVLIPSLKPTSSYHIRDKFFFSHPWSLL